MSLQCWEANDDANSKCVAMKNSWAQKASGSIEKGSNATVADLDVSSVSIRIVDLFIVRLYSQLNRIFDYKFCFTKRFRISRFWLLQIRSPQTSDQISIPKHMEY